MTWEEFLRLFALSNTVDPKVLEAAEVGGHDVMSGPCCCGAWH